MPQGFRRDTPSANLLTLKPVTQTAAAGMLNVSPRGIGSWQKLEPHNHQFKKPASLDYRGLAGFLMMNHQYHRTTENFRKTGKSA